MSDTDEKLTRLEGRVSKLERRVSAKIYSHNKKKIIPIQKRMLTVSEAAEFLGLEVNGVRMLTHKKLIPYYKPNGKTIYFDPEELVAWQHRERQTPLYEREKDRME